MWTRNSMVMGASMGGLAVCKQIVRGLPKDLEAAVCIVWRLSPHAPSLLPNILTRAAKLPLQHALDGKSLQH